MFGNKRLDDETKDVIERSIGPIRDNVGNNIFVDVDCLCFKKHSKDILTGLTDYTLKKHGENLFFLCSKDGTRLALIHFSEGECSSIFFLEKNNKKIKQMATAISASVGRLKKEREIKRTNKEWADFLAKSDGTTKSAMKLLGDELSIYYPDMDVLALHIKEGFRRRVISTTLSLLRDKHIYPDLSVEYEDPNDIFSDNYKESDSVCISFRSEAAYIIYNKNGEEIVHVTSSTIYFYDDINVNKKFVDEFFKKLCDVLKAS